MNCCSGKEIKRLTRQAAVEEKYLQSTYLTKNFYRKNIKNSQNSTVRKQPNHKMGKRPEQNLYQRQYPDGRYAHEKH